MNAKNKLSLHFPEPQNSYKDQGSAGMVVFFTKTVFSLVPLGNAAFEIV